MLMVVVGILTLSVMNLYNPILKHTSWLSQVNGSEKIEWSWATDERTESNLIGVDPELEAIVRYAYETCPIPFIVIDGVRTLDEQKEHLKNGATTTLHSKHLSGLAIDFVPTSFDWNNIEAFTEIGECFKDIDDRIVWGGDWETFRDYGHIELRS